MWIKSDNPVKKRIMAKLKEKTGANKVTLVIDNEDGTYSGHCMKGNRHGYLSLGIHMIDKKEIEESVK